MNSHRFLKQRRLWLELLFCSPLFFVFLLLNIEMEPAEQFYAFLKNYEEFELDEIIFSLMLFLPIYLLVFALQRKHEIEALVSQAGTDPLTGTMNRRRALEILTNEVRRSHRSDSPLSLIVFDVDNFKRINDNFGHPAGDKVLQRLCNCVQGLIRSYDYLARIGGEEFMLIVTEADAKTAVEIAERLRFQIECESFGLDQTVTASFGVTQLRKGESYAELLHRADERLYWAKNEGRNRVIGPS